MLSMLRDRILVKPIVWELSTVLHVTNTERYHLGEVIAVGPGKYNKKGNHMPMDVKLGDIVRWGQFVFPEYTENGIKYQILQEADIAAIVEQS